MKSIYRATFPSLGKIPNELEVEAESFEEATRKLELARIEQVMPTSFKIEKVVKGLAPGQVSE